MTDNLPSASPPLRPRNRNRSEGAPTRHGQLHSRHPLATAAKWLAAVVGVLAVSTASVAAFAIYDTVSNSKPGIHLATLPGTKAKPVPDIGAIEGGANLLLVGTDTRTGQAGFETKSDLAGSSGAGNNDVTMLLHISADHTNASVVSFPRDMIVSAPACGNRSAASGVMFNSTLARGGLSCTVLTVEKMTGLSIAYAAEISFGGVIAMSNAVGGVTVCLATPVKDKFVGLDLAAGQQTLEGATALAFVRSRHGVGDGSDLGRISNQQVFLSALMRKVTSGGVLSNPLTLYSLAKAAVANMQLSDGLTRPTNLVSIALALKGIGLENMVFLQYPTIGDPANPARVIAQQSSANILSAALRADQPVTLTGKTGRAAEVDPAAPATPAPGGTVPATPSATGSATPDPASSAVALPSDVSGQSASQQTCTKGNR
ncbi:LCP family protein [Lacisediminihabitans sp.]|uniref:LCP family protein n=1 Tax=Lacisediminihabitans sp. TaxID=2787631 RepID=UPI002F92806F